MNTNESGSRAVAALHRLLGKGKDAPQRQEPRLESRITADAGLTLLLDDHGLILTCSAPLRARLGRDPCGHTLAQLVAVSQPWLQLQPALWPKQLPLLEFMGSGGATIALGGMLDAVGEELWQVSCLDLTALMRRQHELESQHRLLNAMARLSSRLRGRLQDIEETAEDWLEGLALQLQIAWLGLLVMGEEGWRYVQHYHRPGLTRPLPAPQLLDLDLNSVLIEQPRQQRLNDGTLLWLVPYAEEGRVQSLLVCGDYAAREKAPWLSGEDWVQLFAQFAAPMLLHARRSGRVERERRLSVLEELSSGGWWEFWEHGRVLRLSPSLAKLLQVGATTLPLERWLPLLDPMDRDEFQVRLAAGIDSGEFMHSLRLRVGSEPCWYRFEGRMEGHGEQARLLGFALDISNVHKREEEADATKARLGALVDSAPGVIYVQRYEDGAFPFVFCSASLETLLGWTKDDLQEAPFASLLHPQDRASYFEKYRQLLQQGHASLQYRIRARDGNQHWIQDEAKLLRDERGLPVEVVGVYLDVTAVKEAAERIFRSEESYRTLVDDSPAIICRYQPDLTVIFANPTLASALNIPHEQTEGLNLGDYLSTEQKEAARIRFSQLTPSLPAASAEICIRRSDMETRWWVLYERGIFDEHGKLLEVQAVGRDNTEVHQTRQQLFQSAKMATLGEMAAGLAHEINQPLSVIQMTLANLTQRVAGGSATPTYVGEKLERIAGQVQRAAGIVNHVRVFGRWSGVEGVLFDPRRCIDGALSLVGQKLDLMEIKVLRSVLEELPAVKGQPDRLEQVLINLLMNAAHVLLERRQRESGLEARVSIGTQVNPESITLTVEDNGGGIPQAIVGRIFEPFFTTKPPDQGTGLGLAVSREIIAQMGGTLRAENHAEGARFIIDLPLPGTGPSQALTQGLA
jgi:PAS domain S-box-containing protein